MRHKDIFRDLHFILHVKTQKKDQDYSEDCIIDLRLRFSVGLVHVGLPLELTLAI